MPRVTFVGGPMDGEAWSFAGLKLVQDIPARDRCDLYVPLAAEEVTAMAPFMRARYRLWSTRADGLPPYEYRWEGMFP